MKRLELGVGGMSCAACSLRDPREQVSTLYSSVL